MREKDLYDTLCALVPVNREGANDTEFRTVLSKTLGNYMKCMNDLKKSGVLNENNHKEIYKICDKLKEIIRAEYKGLHSSAFMKFSNLMIGESKLSGLSNSIIVGVLGKKEKALYRMRKMENRRNVKTTDLFHIPLTNRGIVTTNRYSAPGFPCLYLGTSIYACWEELGRPPMSQSMVSRLTNEEEIHLVDLRIPSFEMFKDNTDQYLKTFPLIIACSVMVKESDAHYKPEYLIPQLLMEFVINNNVKNKTKHHIDGVYYTSVFKSDDFGFPLDKYENIVIPVQSPLSNTKYCPILCEKFKITKPTCDEIEQARSGGYDTIQSDEQQESLAINQGRIQGYDTSSFGYLEKRLRDENLFPLQKVDG